MKAQSIRSSAMLGFVLISILILLLGSCQKQPVVISNSSLHLGTSSYELKSAYYSNHWDTSNFYGGELILAGPTIYFDSPTGFFNSNGKSAFVIIMNSELGQLKPGDYDLSPGQTWIHMDADPKPTDSTTMRNLFQPVGDVIEGKMRITKRMGLVEIDIAGSCYVNKIRTDLNVRFTGPVSNIPEPYHLVK